MASWVGQSITDGRLSKLDWIEVILNAVSTDGNDELQLRLGDSGGVESTGYVGGHIDDTGTNNSVDGFHIRATGAADTGYAVYQLKRVTGNVWVCSWNGFNVDDGGNDRAMAGCGSKTTSGTLDRVQITTAAGDTFDSGTIKVVYGYDA